MRLLFLVLFLVLFLGVSAAVSAQTLTTAITYQGELEFQGQPAQGAYDFEFLLFDAETSGNLVTTLVVEDVPVQAGLFSVELDFGPGVFIGEDRWLELGVRAGASTGSFTGLLPRQTLTPAPFALHAEGVAAAAIGTIEIEDGSITADDLSPGAVGAVAIDATEVQTRITGSCPAGQAMVSVDQNGQIVCAPSADPTDFNGADPVGSVQTLGSESQTGGVFWFVLDAFDVTSGSQAGEVMAIGNALAGCVGCAQGEIIFCEITIIESNGNPPGQGESAGMVTAGLVSNIGTVLEFQQAANTTATYLLLGRNSTTSDPGKGCSFSNRTAAGIFQPK